MTGKSKSNENRDPADKLNVKKPVKKPRDTNRPAGGKK